MRGARPALALAGSLLAHLCVGAALLPWLAPRPVPQQASGQSRILLATVQVRQGRAEQQVPEAADAVSARATGARMAGQGVPQRRAGAVRPQGKMLGEAAAQGARTGPVAAAGQPVAGTDAAGDRQRAAAPDSERLAAVSAVTESVSTVAVAGIRQVPVLPEVRPASALPVPVAVVVGLNIGSVVQTAATPQGETVAAATVAGRTVPEAAVHLLRADSVQVAAARGRALVAAGLPAVATAPAGGLARAAQPDARPAAALAATARAAVRPEMTGRPVTAVTATRPVSAPTAATGRPVVAARPASATAGALDSAGTLLRAGLEWSGAGSLALDPQSLATLQAFLQPGAAPGQAVRDGMARALAAPDCARVHTAFDADSGTLELRGHVAAAADRAPLLASLREQIGGALELRDRLQILPRPQCALLDAISDLGLPQSEEQLTDSDLVGENAQVREYSFDAGDRLVIDLTAPDYPAYVRVDYFDASGQVLHLMPNERTPLRRFAPGEPFSIGRGDDLDLRIAPPFGQDIAVAFATSQPLTEPIRPLVEPAEPYLAALRDRVAAARAADPGFRGEWVYLFVATSGANP